MKKNFWSRLGKIDHILLAGACLCLVLALCPFSFYKNLGDRLSPDGSMERLTPRLFPVIRLLFLAGGAVFIGLILWKLFSPDSRKRFFDALFSLPGRCVHDIRPFFHDLGRAVRPDNGAGFWCFLVIFAVGIIIRWLRINTPLMHDEAYTMAIWGRSDLLFAVSDYHLPNNHVFHSVLVNLIYHHVGKSVMLLRLPVFISGCLLIPAVWLLGKLVYNDFAALTAGGFTAAAPFLIAYSVNARGYEVQALFTVLTIGLAVYGKRKNNIFAWFLLILFSALNFFTLPIALYPFGGICVWLFLNVIFPEKNMADRKGRLRLFRFLIFMGVCVSVLTLLLYTPLLRYSGWNSLFGNIYIGGTEASTFDQTMISRLKDNAAAFIGSWPLPVVCIVAAGLILSVIFFRKSSREKHSVVFSILLWMCLLIPFQKPNLWPRTLLFFHPLLLLSAASGIAGICFGPKIRKAAGWACAALIIAAGISQFKLPEQAGPDERAVRIIIDSEGENAANVHLITAPQDDAPIWIYADAYGLPRKIFDRRVSFNTVYAFVNPLNDAYEGPQSLAELIDRFGPGDMFFDLNRSSTLMNEPDGILYRFDGKESTIRKAYGDYPEMPQADPR